MNAAELPADHITGICRGGVGLGIHDTVPFVHDLGKDDLGNHESIAEAIVGYLELDTGKGMEENDIIGIRILSRIGDILCGEKDVLLIDGLCRRFVMERCLTVLSIAGDRSTWIR